MLLSNKNTKRTRDFLLLLISSKSHQNQEPDEVLIALLFCWRSDDRVACVSLGEPFAAPEWRRKKTKKATTTWKVTRTTIATPSSSSRSGRQLGSVRSLCVVWSASSCAACFVSLHSSLHRNRHQSDLAQFRTL